MAPASDRRLTIAPSLLAADFARLRDEVAGDRGRRRRLAASRHHGRPFRPQPQLRPAGAASAPPAHPPAIRRPLDDQPGRSLPRRLRRGRRRPHPPAPRGRAAPAPLAAGHPRARQARRRGAEPRHPGRGRCLAARTGRHRAGDDRQSRIRRAGFPALAACQDRRAAADDRRRGSPDRPGGGRRHLPRHRAVRGPGRRRHADRRHRGVRRRRLCRRDRRIACGGGRRNHRTTRDGGRPRPRHGARPGASHDGRLAASLAARPASADGAPAAPEHVARAGRADPADARCLAWRRRAWRAAAARRDGAGWRRRTAAARRLGRRSRLAASSPPRHTASPGCATCARSALRRRCCAPAPWSASGSPRRQRTPSHIART